MLRRKILYLPITLVLAGISVGVIIETQPAHADASRTGSDCTGCHGNPGMTKTLPTGEEKSLYVDAEAYTQSVHGSLLACQACHSGYEAFPHPSPDTQPSEEYMASARTVCQTCHPVPYDEMLGGAHADSAGNNAMTCVDCHGAHDIREAQAPVLRATTLALCRGCHEDRQLMEAYGVSTNVVTTYLRDFHGRTSLLKTKTGTQAWIEEAVCTDCHGSHSILRVGDDDSRAMKENLTATCRQCHAGATPNFPDSWMSHYEPTPEKTPLVFLAQAFYWIMIPFTIAGLLMHIGIDLRHKIKTHKTS